MYAVLVFPTFTLTNYPNVIFLGHNIACNILRPFKVDLCVQDTEGVRNYIDVMNNKKT